MIRPLKSLNGNRGRYPDSGLFTRTAGQGAIGKAVGCGLVSHPAKGPVTRISGHGPSVHDV